MNHNAYFYWLMASIAAGNKPSYEERKALDEFMRYGGKANRD